MSRKRGRSEPAEQLAPEVKSASTATVYKILEGDLLDCKADAIAHQCNCVTVSGRGLYSALVEKYPYSDVYSRRKSSKTRPKLGSIEICRSADAQSPSIVCLYSQLGPGKPGQASKKYGIKASADAAEKRLEYFEAALSALADAAQAEQWKMIALPYNIGCGLAGGNWEDYSRMLNQFAAKLPSITICLYKKQ